MKRMIFLIALVSQNGRAARIIDATWSPLTQTVTLSMSFQGGCLAHQFSIDWDVCAADGSRFGQIYDSGENDQCPGNLEQVFDAQEPSDGCVSNVLILKSTSSRASVTIEK